MAGHGVFLRGVFQVCIAPKVVLDDLKQPEAGCKIKNRS